MQSYLRWVIIFVIALCQRSNALNQMLNYAKVSNQLELNIPPIETWPNAIRFTFDDSSDGSYTSTDAKNALPSNKTAGFFCPERIKDSADYFWSLCPANIDLSSTNLHCNIMQMYALQQAQECIEFHDNYIKTETSRDLKPTGFWSSRCRCFSVITRILDLLANSNGWKYCSIATTDSANQDFQTVYSSSSMPPYISVSSPWLSLFSGVDDLIDTMTSKNQTEGTIIAQFKTHWPYYIDFLTPEKWYCYDDITVGHAEDYYGGDSTPYSTQDIAYMEKLFWAIPPDNAFEMLNNNNVPSSASNLSPFTWISIPSLVKNGPCHERILKYKSSLSQLSLLQHNISYDILSFMQFTLGWKACELIDTIGIFF